MNPIRLGIVGAGGAYDVLHRPVLEAQPDHYQIVAVYDPEPTRSIRSAARTNAAVFESLDDLLRSPNVDAVLIASGPIGTRFDTIQRALEAGKHVVAERPLAASAAQCDQLVPLARRRGVLLTSTHFRRWDNAFVHAQNRIRNGEVGTPVLVQLATPSVAGEDAVLGTGFDLLDFALLLNDSGLAEISAAPNLSRMDVVDTFTATCRFDKPPAMTITVYPSPPNAMFGLPRFAVIGTRGAFTDTSLVNAPDAQPFYEGVWRAIRERGAPPVVASSARNAVYLAECLLASMREGHAVRTERLTKSVE
jgi:predicted dehydrogenase